VSKKNEHIFKNVREKWEDYLEPKDKIDKEKFEIKKYDFSDLLECCEEWKEKEAVEGFLCSYQIAIKLLKEYKIPFLSEDEINDFVDGGDKDYLYHGVFISAIINELYKSEEFHLNSDKINYIGCYNEDKKIVVEGDCGYGMGSYMKSGKIVVEGDCGYYIGINMNGGEIRIYGDNFNPKEQISEYAQKGEIYHKDELVWKDGELIGEEI
ncbi:MAG: hypothetical protein KAU95_03195, partial [Candidatus Aenigmarchaeota archaeon]|nr:hypothetical protein [Candidatus Aenigmarchaeota archaeon]